MYMGGISGLMGAFFYENGKENPNGFVGLLIAFLATLIVSALGGLIYSFLTITLRANQNVVGLALTTFGVGFGNFFGGSISKACRRCRTDFRTDYGGSVSCKNTGTFCNPCDRRFIIFPYGFC